MRVRVRDGSGMFMGRTRLVTRDHRTSNYRTLNSAKNVRDIGHGLEQLQVDAMREQQSKRTQSGSSS